MTPLAWDFADRISEIFNLDSEVVIGWEETSESSADELSDGTFGYGYDHSYCLVFQQTES